MKRIVILAIVAASLLAVPAVFAAAKTSKRALLPVAAPHSVCYTYCYPSGMCTTLCY